MNSFFNWRKNDDWETPLCYWEQIVDLIPNDLTINDPFYMNGNAKKHWAKLGKKIIH